MLKYILPFFLALALAPAVAGAQSSPPPPGPPGRPPMAAMRQMRTQMMQIHQQARTAMLSALTPQHRTLLQNVVGGLAVAPSPNVRAAAAQLNAALSPTEQQAILTAAKQERTQMRAMIAQLRAKYPPPAGHSPRPHRSFTPRTPSAGAVLLRTVIPGMGPMMMWHGGPPQGGGPMGPGAKP